MKKNYIKKKELKKKSKIKKKMNKKIKKKCFAVFWIRQIQWCFQSQCGITVRPQNRKFQIINSNNNYFQFMATQETEKAP